MSFSLKIKRELMALISLPACCKAVELAAMSASSVGDVGGFACPSCARAFIRGIFLSGGNVTVPKKSGLTYKGDYQMEISLQDRALAEAVCELIERELDQKDVVKILERDRRFVLYIKRQDVICDFLTLMGAQKSMLNLLDIIMMRQAINRANSGANCINANLDRLSTSSARQVAAIERLKDSGKLNLLPKNLVDLANLRLENPELTLGELAEKLGISKSGIKHRFNRIIECADKTECADKDDI